MLLKRVEYSKWWIQFWSFREKMATFEEMYGYTRQNIIWEIVRVNGVLGSIGWWDTINICIYFFFFFFFYYILSGRFFTQVAAISRRNGNFRRNHRKLVQQNLSASVNLGKYFSRNDNDCTFEV